MGEAEKNKGAQGNPGGQGAPIVRLHDVSTQTPPTLSEIFDKPDGAAKMQASRAMALAAIPQPTFDAEIVRRAAKHGEKKALVEQAAAYAGIAPSTMYKNAAVSDVVGAYCEILSTENFPTTINKDDVQQSLRSMNPVQALAAIVEQKTAHDVGRRSDLEERRG